MGSRLGVIVLTDAGAELYYDHWAAQTIGIDIAIDGFEATLDRVRTMEPMGVRSPAEWHGATWIEGSLLIDVMQRRVVWAEESDYLYLPRIINQLIETTWPGWSALWSPEGVRGILWLAGVDPSTLFTPQRDLLPAKDSLTWFVPWGNNNYDDAISVYLDDTQLVVWRGGGYFEDVASLGPDTIRSVAEEARSRGAAGEPVIWDLQVRDHPPDTGIHIDFRDKTVRWWSLGDDDSQIDAFNALWPPAVRSCPDTAAIRGRKPAGRALGSADCRPAEKIAALRHRQR